MSPNLFLLLRKATQPQEWFQPSPQPQKAHPHTEYRQTPERGLYETIPGRGTYLIALAGADPSTPTTPVHPPRKLEYSRVLHRHIFADDYARRKRQGRLADAAPDSPELGFFQLDDGVTYVNCFDDRGRFVAQHYRRYRLDARTGRFRPMLKGDDPAWLAARGSARSSQSRASGSTRASADASVYVVPAGSPSEAGSQSTSVSGAVTPT